jgi:hypothetical protein
MLRPRAGGAHLDPEVSNAEARTVQEAAKGAPTEAILKTQHAAWFNRTNTYLDHSACHVWAADLHGAGRAEGLCTALRVVPGGGGRGGGSKDFF